MFKKNKIVIVCILASLILHILILCTMLLFCKKRIAYMSSSIDVVFYSNASNILQSSDTFLKNFKPYDYVDNEIINDDSTDKTETVQESKKIDQKDTVTVDKKEHLKKIDVQKNIKRDRKKDIRQEIKQKVNNDVAKKSIPLDKKDVTTVSTENSKISNSIDSYTDITSGSNSQANKTSGINNFSKFGAQYEGLSFNDNNFKFTYYANQIISRIKKHWSWSLNYSQLKTVVYFKINRDGTVSDILIKKSSKNNEYDKFAADTIVRASPFPQLPEGYVQDFLGVYFEFIAN